MKSKNLGRDAIDFGNGRIGPVFRSLFFPTLVGMMFNSALTVIDGVFVGHGVGADGIAAVNIVAPLYLVTTGVGLMFGIGASVVASIRLAEENVKAARIILTQAFVAGFIILGFVGVLCLAFPRDILYALGCSFRLEDKAADYMLWLVPGLFFLFAQCVGMMLIRLDGNPRYAMWIQVLVAVVNIALDWYMIFSLDMGVKGAAVATSAACVFGGLMALAYFVRFSYKLRFYRLKLSVTSLLLSIRNVTYIMKIGFATFLTELAMGVMMLTGNYMFMSMLNEEGVAAFAVACYLFPIVFSISNAVAQSAQPIISFNHGVRSDARVARTLRVSLFTAAVCGMVVSLCLWIGAPAITALFLAPSEAAYGIAVAGLPLFALCAVFFSVNIAFIGYYQSVERAMASTVFTSLRGMLLLVPSFVLLPHALGVSGLWLAIPTAEFLTLVSVSLFYLRQIKRSAA